MITSICEKHLEREFIRELSPNIKCFDLMDFEYNHDSIQIKSTIKFFRSKTRYPQLRKKTTKQILQPCLDFISQQQRLASYMSPIDDDGSNDFSLNINTQITQTVDDLKDALIRGRRVTYNNVTTIDVRDFFPETPTLIKHMFSYTSIENASESGKAELLKQVAEERTKHEVENAELKSRIEELEKGRTDTVAENGGSGDDNEENKQEI
ncbi:2234_t:CDS:2 [Rhizophagus irregularis]|nr:2234_t:CDS:2 [Rhizophagus irregularis]